MSEEPDEAASGIGPIGLVGLSAFENSGTAPLEFLVVGVERDVNKKNDLLAMPPQRLGSSGRAGGAAAACKPR